MMYSGSMGFRSEKYDVWAFSNRIEHIHTTSCRLCENRYYFFILTKNAGFWVKWRKNIYFYKSDKMSYECVRYGFRKPKHHIFHFENP